MAEPEENANPVIKPLRFKLTSKAGRGGCDDPAVVLEAMKNDWESLHSELDQLPEEEQNAMKGHFNEFVADCDTIGDALFDESSDEFIQTVDNLETKEKKEVINEIMRVEKVSQAQYSWFLCHLNPRKD